MRRHLIYPAGLIVLAAACDGPLPPVCGGALSDACRKASDMAYALGVQLADESNDGSVVLGDVGTMGETGKGALSFRVNAVGRNAVRMDGVTARTDGTSAASTFRTDRGVATALSISGVVGAFGGVPAGPTRVGGIDFLGSLAVAASTDHGDLELKSRPSMMGIGVRLGLMQETPSLPAVSFTSMVHAGSKFSMKTPRLPTDTQEGVVLRLENGDLSTLGLRLGASKTFGAFGVSGGAGRTIYFIDSDYSVDGTGSLGYGNQNITFTVRRTNAFVGATYTRKRLTFGAELGRLMGGDVSETLNTFGDGANAAHNYLSLGIRIPAGRSISK